MSEVGAGGPRTEADDAGVDPGAGDEADRDYARAGGRRRPQPRARIEAGAGRGEREQAVGR